MYRILFVCTGNICRSPMAEAVMRDMVQQQSLEDQIEVDSAGVISYHAGELADGRARDELASHGVDYDGNAREVTSQDFDDFDLILGMTQSHVEELKRRAPRPAHDKIKLFLDFAPDATMDEVPDPYYVGNFSQVYELIYQGCEGLLQEVIKNFSNLRNS